MQLRDGIVKNVMAKDLKDYTDEGWTILDVRPPNETRKVHVADSVEVPLFVPDTSLDPSSLLKQMSAFGLGGWWLGGTHMKANNGFLADVQAKVCFLNLLKDHVIRRCIDMVVSSLCKVTGVPVQRL